MSNQSQKEPVKFRVVKAPTNQDGDTVNDITTVQWPDSRRNCKKLLLDEAHEQKQIIFDPIPRVDISSDDPLLELRAAVYLLSGRRRRSAPE